MRLVFSKYRDHCSPLSLLFILCSITILVLSNHGLDNVVDKEYQRTSTCSPCTATYLAADPNYPNILSNKHVSMKSCENLLDIAKIMYRSLEGEGSHRWLISRVLGVESDSSSTYLDSLNCELVIIESLNGVFADPFELQRVVNRKVSLYQLRIKNLEDNLVEIVIHTIQFKPPDTIYTGGTSCAFLDAAVFGDTNLELPAALSNSSFVEIHMDLVPSLKKNRELVIELPLHVRYAPLDGSGYSVVEISQPDLYIRCKKKDMDHGCQWGTTFLEVEPTETVKWLIPCGDEAHITVVSSLTFLSALICALSIVFSSIFYHPTIYSKDQ